MIKVSIVVPVYNVEKYLEKCLDSLINQTLKDIEIICVNDGSTDNSGKILDEYAQKDNRIVVINKENGGVSSARNLGLSAVRGEYIGFCDPDDWVDLDYYERLYDAAISSNSDIAVGGIKRVKNKITNFLVFDDTYFSEEYYEKLKLCNVPDRCYIWNKIYKTSEYKKHNLLFIEGLNYEDCVFTPEILYKLKKLITVPNTYYYYLRQYSSITRQRSNRSDKVKALNMALDFIKSKGIQLNNVMTLERKFKLFGLTIFKVLVKNDNVKAKIFNLFEVDLK